MKIILMAAGKGIRAHPNSNGKAKSLITFKNGKTLLDMQIDSMQKSKVIDEIIMILGYQSYKIKKIIAQHNKNRKIQFKTIFNPFFEATNNLVSLWFAKNQMTDDFLISNGDNYFLPEVYNMMANQKTKGYCLAVTTEDKNDYGKDYMKVTISNDKTVIYASKLIKKGNYNGVSTGLFRVSGKKYAKIFQNILDELVERKENHSKFWLEAINLLNQKGFKVQTQKVFGKKVWREIDYPQDIESVQELFQN